MVGSDKDSVKSGEPDFPKPQEETLERQESCTPPPKPPRIYDTVEGLQNTPQEVINIKIYSS